MVVKRSNGQSRQQTGHGTGKLESWKAGKLESWKAGKLESWN
jgi:hypothetical protein